MRVLVSFFAVLNTEQRTQIGRLKKRLTLCFEVALAVFIGRQAMSRLTRFPHREFGLPHSVRLVSVEKSIKGIFEIPQFR